MGLPIWRDPDEDDRKKPSSSSALSRDIAAHSRSPIRRYSILHGRQHPRLMRQHSVRSTDRASTPYNLESIAARSIGDLRQAVGIVNRHISPISVLLEPSNHRNNSNGSPAPNHANQSRQASGNQHRTLPAQDDTRETTASDRDASFRQGATSENPSARPHEAPMLRARRRFYDRSSDDSGSASHARPPLRARRRFYDRPGDDIRHSAQPIMSQRPQVPPHRHHMHLDRNRPRYPGQIVDGPLLEVPRATVLDDSRTRMYRSPEPLTNPRHSTGPRVPTAQPGRAASPGADSTDEESGLQFNPFRRAWRLQSTINGLGDRSRSPSFGTGDGWEIMRSTIEPDRNLPSTDSSFASTAVSNSFASNNGTHVTVPESPDSEDLACVDSGLANALATFAEYVYEHEECNEHGMQRIRHHRQNHEADESRFASSTEDEKIDIGYRLIEETISTEAGREQLSRVINEIRLDITSFAARARAMSRRLGDDADEETLLDSWHRLEYLIVTGSETLIDHLSLCRCILTGRVQTSPSQAYRQDSAMENDLTADADISTEGPQPHPVSPPSGLGEVVDAPLSSSGESGDDLDTARMIIQRLSQRDDIPEEWWMSMGLNLSRTMPAARRHRRHAMDLDARIMGGEARAESRGTRGPRL